MIKGYIYRVSQKKKTAIIMKGQMKYRHNTLIYFKSICAQGCSNSYNLRKFHMGRVFLPK